MLRNIVEAACELAGARYGALGVIGDDGGLEQFIHVGMDDETAARIGHLPEGKGLLGALITDPRPIRLDAHDRRRTVRSGFPPDHPPMDSFLGVPIRVRGEVFGNLYLADSANGEFSAEDEELVARARARGRHGDQQRPALRRVAAAAALARGVGRDRRPAARVVAARTRCG